MEILAPAGNKENLISAINGGANAVYLGLTDFSARKSADNFTFEDLEFSISYAKAFNVKVYLTVNTLIKNSELSAYFEMIKKAYLMGVDAFIIQDIFLGKKLKELIPNITLHLSTQAGVCNEYGAILAKKYGFSRVILARETKLNDIKKICKIIETEVFVQGALCTSFSGHCYFSSFIGGNSGNRGYCKQPCRKKCSYFNGQDIKLTSGYSLSLADLNLSYKLNELKNIGVSSLKIEGRMRSKEYVYYASKHYFNLLNGITDKETEINLYKTYNRGDYTLGLAFLQDKNFISNKIQGHKGYFVSKVNKIINNKLIIDKNALLLEGNSYKIIRNGEEVGNSICVKDSSGLSLRYKGEVKVGDSLYITKDEAIKPAFNKKVNVNVVVSAKKGDNLKLKCNDIEVVSSEILEEAKSQPITKEDIIKNLNKTDVYPYNVTVEFENFSSDIFIVKSKLNSLRAELYQKLFNRKNDILFDKISDSLDFSILNCKGYSKENSVILSKIAKISSDVKNVIYSPTNYLEDFSEFINFYGDKKVWLYLPAYMASDDIDIINCYANKFYGVFIEGSWGLEYAINKNLKVFVGTGLNIFNNIDVNVLSSYKNIEQIALSKELSKSELSDFNDSFTLLNASELQIMDLIYCPFNKNCKNCKFTENSYLKDEENRKFLISRYKFNECRFKVFNMAKIYYKGVNNFNTLYDLTNKNKDFIEEFFLLNNNAERAKLFSNLTVGNYSKGIK